MIVSDGRRDLFSMEETILTQRWRVHIAFDLYIFASFMTGLMMCKTLRICWKEDYFIKIA